MKLTPIQFSNESITYIAPSWSQLEDLSFILAQKILKDKLRIDRIVTLAKGGWPQTCSLIDFLGIDYVASIGIKFYSGIGKMMDKPDIYQDIPPVIRNETVLLFDDIADTGKSLVFTKDHLRDFAVKKVYTASLFYRNHCSLTPDYYAQEVNSWIVFPFEARETIEQLGLKWAKQGLNKQEIIKRFKKFNFKDEIINYYLKI
ncbi:hypothetical protein GYA49_02055 [Candidatus Beckwithbacteria bacterium]|nr:hypothetical protein [Candidatus Beckwithbacteria bacterium]